jgi:hypothetical protein
MAARLPWGRRRALTLTAGQVRRDLANKCPIRRRDERVSQREECPQPPVIDRANDPDVAPGLLVPEDLDLKLILGTRSPDDRDMVVTADSGDEIPVGQAAILGELVSQ